MREQRSYCFVSNYLTPHQLPFCLAMQRETGDRFVFIETEELPEERKNLGYPSLGEQYGFVLNAKKDAASFQKAMRIATESDVTIIGSAPNAFIKPRLRQNKLTLRFSERIFKKRYVDPLRWAKHTLKNISYRNKNLFFMLSSAYAPHDYMRCGMRTEKMFKWGYFPKVSTDSCDETVKQDGKIVWVGRFLPLKHADDAIRAVIQLKQEGYPVTLDLVGSGETQEFLQDIVKENQADEYIRFVGNQPYDQVREYMRSAEIFLFTSDYHEGWGAVLNEAMDSGCAVVASHAAGGVPFLIEHQRNGLIYRFEDKIQLYEHIKLLLTDKALLGRLAEQAKTTVTKEWNADRATEKLMDFCNAFFAGDYRNGVCKDGIFSSVQAISQKNMYQEIARKH